MYRFKLTFSMGICFLFFCLAGDVNRSVAKDKESPVTLNTCICNQVPLYPVGIDLWAWMAYQYQYETDCTTATATSIINFSEYEDYPESLCVDQGVCGDECSVKGVPGRKKITTEPAPSHYMHVLPATSSAKLDLYPPQIDLHYDILETRFLKFRRVSRNTRYAKVFLICLSANDDPNVKGDSIYFWYGFEVDSIPSSENPLLLPYTHVNRRASFLKEDKPGNVSEGKCGEFSLVNYGGSQFLIRFKKEAGSKDKCSECENSKADVKKTK